MGSEFNKGVTRCLKLLQGTKFQFEVLKEVFQFVYDFSEMPVIQREPHLESKLFQRCVFCFPQLFLESNIFKDKRLKNTLQAGIFIFVRVDTQTKNFT